MYERYEHLRIERRGRVLVVALHNPPQNTVSAAMHAELARVFDDIDADPESAVVVLTGSGNAFTAGADIKSMLDRAQTGVFAPQALAMQEQADIVRGLLDLRKPVIARVNGDAYGVGAALVAFSDMAFMLDTARIADSHVKVGLSAGDGCSLMWPLLMGFNRAREYLFTGDAMTGTQAAALGLVNAAVSASELDARVFGFADRLASGATMAINATKRSVNLLLKRLLDDLVEAHLGLETYTFFSDDHKEAVAAFVEKRKPRFTGK